MHDTPDLTSAVERIKALLGPPGPLPSAFKFGDLQLPDPPPPARPPPPPRQPQPTLTPEEVWTLWTNRGLQWLQNCPRRDRRAAATSFQDPSWISTAPERLPLLKALWPLIKGKQRNTLFTTAWFSQSPTNPGLPVLFDPSDRTPAWWNLYCELPQPQRIQWLGRTLLQLFQESVDGQSSIRISDLELTTAILIGPWFRPLIDAISPASLDDARRLLGMADHGLLHGPPQPVSHALHTAIVRIIEFGDRMVDDRAELADMLQGRLGPIFGQAIGQGWTTPPRANLTSLPTLHQRVRSWLMGQVLDILFTHLAPKDGPYAHQVRPRHTFWKNPRFVSRMRKVYILAGSEFDHVMESPDITDLLSRFPGNIARRQMKGTDGQAILWMHWTAVNKQTWTIIEGNLNCKVRIRRGVYEPPRLFQAGQLLPVDYSAAIVNGDLGDSRPHHDSTHLITSDDHVFRKPHNGQNWAPETLAFLRNNGVIE